jgi:hypothetical protein
MGPSPDALKVEGHWKDAIRKSFKKKKIKKGGRR